MFFATFGEPLPVDNASSKVQGHEVSREAIPLTVSFAGTVTADKTLRNSPRRCRADRRKIAGQEGDRFGAGFDVLVELR